MIAVFDATLASGLRLSCASSGVPDGPIALMVPGPTDSLRSYEPTLARLPTSIRGIAVSPRGHGDSDKPASGYGVAHYATDTVELLDSLEIDRAVLVAHSGSCMPARRVAIDHPDRVSGLVLEASPMTLVGDDGLQAFVTSVVNGLEDPIDADFAREWLGDTGGAEHPELDTLVDEVRKVPAHVWKETLGDLLTYDDTALLGAVTAPTQLIWGDLDPLVDRASQDALVSALPRATLTVYEGVGHAPRWEAADRFAADVAAFVSNA